MMKNEVINGTKDFNISTLPECGEDVCSYFPVTTLIPLTVISLIVMIIGIIGNTITILIVWRYKEMKTTTNFYLSSMAVSDMVILLCLPFDLYRLWKSTPWVLGGFLCKFIHFISEGCTYSTILHITALSIERYLAICFPLKAKVYVTKRRVKMVIAFLWVFAMISASPFYFMIDAVPLYTNSSETILEILECKYTTYAMTSGLLDIMMWVTSVYFFFPMPCLSVLYGFIGKTLWKTKNEVRGPNAAHRQKCHRQTVRILAVVVLAFVICWLPFHIGRLAYVYTMDYQTILVFSQYFNLVAMELFYLSASINPILYNVISKKYRAAAYKLLNCNPPERKTYNAISENTTGNTENASFIQNQYNKHSQRSNHKGAVPGERSSGKLFHFVRPFPKRIWDIVYPEYNTK